MSNVSLTLQQAADRLGVHYMTMYRYVRLGLLPAHKEGGCWQVDVRDLDAFRSPTERGAARGEAPWADRLEARLLAGDLTGAWGVIEAALGAGTEPADVYVDLLAPALASIGERWHRGEVGIEDEHVASAIAARLVGRLSLRFSRRGRPRGSVITAMPPGERHGLGVSMLADVLRGHGYAVTDLGPDTPTESLLAAIRKSDRVDAVCLSVVYSGALAAAATTVETIRRQFPGLPVLVGGRAIPDEETARQLGADAWAATPSAAGELLDQLLSDQPVD